MKLVESHAAYLVLVAVAAIDSWLSYRFFTGAITTAQRYGRTEAAVPE